MYKLYPLWVIHNLNQTLTEKKTAFRAILNLIFSPQYNQLCHIWLPHKNNSVAQLQSKTHCQKTRHKYDQTYWPMIIFQSNRLRYNFKLKFLTYDRPYRPPLNEFHSTSITLQCQTKIFKKLIQSVLVNNKSTNYKRKGNKNISVSNRQIFL